MQCDDASMQMFIIERREGGRGIKPKRDRKRACAVWCMVCRVLGNEQVLSDKGEV